jgi:hypothetical protein
MRRTIVSLLLLLTGLWQSHTGGGGAGGSSANIVYNQGSTGAVNRTTTNKLQENLSVLDFGADPTGTNDSTTAVINAIAYSGTNPSSSGLSGNRITFPCGLYKISPVASIQPYTGTVIQGGGKGCTFIKSSNTSTSIPDWAVNTFSTTSPNFYGQNVEFRDLTILGDNATAGHVCMFFGTPNTSTPKVQNITLVNVKVTQCGIGVQTGDVWNLTTLNSQIIFNLGDGLQINDNDAVTGMYLFGTRVGNNGGHNINNIGAGTVTQLEQFGGEDTYASGGTEVVTGNARDWDFNDVWFEEAGAGTTQNGIDVTGCVHCNFYAIHSNFNNNLIFASSTVTYITIQDSTMTNGQTNFVNVPSGSTHINFSQNNTANVSSSVGSATAQNSIDCPNATSFSLTTQVGLAVNACSGNDIFRFFANGTLESYMTNVGAWYAKTINSLSGSAFSSMTTGTSSAGTILNRNETDAFATFTVNNLNASSTGDILDVQFQSTNQDGYTVQGIPFHRVGSAVASATTIAPTSPAFHITGTTQITTITPPTSCTTAAETGCTLMVIPDAAFTTATSGNIAIASTAVIGKLMILIYDQTQAKWYPSY